MKEFSSTSLFEIKSYKCMVAGLVYITIMTIIPSCSGKSKEIASKTELICKLTEEANNGCCTEYRAESIGREIRTLKWEITLANPYWKGRPYEDIISGLSEYYDLNDYADFKQDSMKSHTSILLIHPSDIKTANDERMKWNKDAAENIKKIINRELNSSQVVDEEFRMAWSAPEYDIEVRKNSSDNICLEFLSAKVN